MSHRARTRGPVSGLVLLGTLWMKKDISLCHPNQLSPPPCEINKVGTNSPILQMTKVKSSFLCPFCKWPAPCQFRRNDFVLTVTALFPLICLSARLCFLQIIVFPGFWNNTCGECSEQHLLFEEKVVAFFVF